MSNDSHAPSGVFITFEGGEGVGKTTHINFLARALRSQGREVVCLREPGGTAIGEELRAVVLDPANVDMADETELLVYEAARAQIVHQVIGPALLRGAVVLCDRFYDSTVAYQVYGRGLSREFVRQANEFACQGMHPHRTVLLETASSASVGLERATHHGQADRMEQAGLDFHTRVNQAFHDIAEVEPERMRVIVSQEAKSATARLIFTAVADVVGWNPEALPFDEEFFQMVNCKNSDEKAVIERIG
jgi:dTMP kinase